MAVYRLPVSATSFVAPRPESNVVDVFALPGSAVLVLADSADIPPDAGVGGLEVFDGSNWLTATDWTIYEGFETEVVFNLPTGSEPIGWPWRLSPSFAVTVDGNPIYPRSGVIAPYPEMLRAAKIAGVEALQSYADKEK